MQVILIRDVPNVGKAGDVKEVSDGYGRNYLLPRGLAAMATEGQQKQAEQHRRSATKRRERESSEAEGIAERISGLTLTFQARTGEGTKLYGSITSADIAERLSQVLGQEFDRRKIHLEESLRQLGAHQVPVRLTADLVPEITVVIEREGEEPEGE